jgi:hypothetical protein
MNEQDRANATRLENMREWHESIAQRIGSGKLTAADDVLALMKSEIELRQRALVPTSNVRTVRLADVAPERVEWLWDGRIAHGTLTLLDGDPGLGKSTMALDLAARVSRGLAMPFDIGSASSAADVIILSAEDHLATTIRPRLDAAGADVRRVHAITAMPRTGDPDAPPTLAPDDIAKLEATIKTRQAKLVIVDPLMAFLTTDVDAHKDQDVRRVLRLLAAVAERTGAAIVVVRHLRKGAGSALHRGAGSIGIAGAARSVLLVAPEPSGVLGAPSPRGVADAPDDGVRVVAQVKSNLSKLSHALRWRLMDAGGVARIEWVGVAEGVTADQLAAPPPVQENEGGSKLARAVAALQDVLSDGPVPAKQAIAAVIDMVSCSPRTVEQARAQLGVEAIRVRTPDGRRVQRVDLRLPMSTPQSANICGVENPAPHNRVNGHAIVESGLLRNVYVANGDCSVEPRDVRPPWERSHEA